MQIHYRQNADLTLPSADELTPARLLDYLYRLREPDYHAQDSLAQLPPPKHMHRLDKATELLSEHLRKQQRIIIVGDYDADGATSTALLLLGLHAMGAKHVDYIVPSRHTHGYGLTPQIVDILHAEKPADLIITVDNGIAAHEGVERAKSLGYDVIVTDHHLAGDTLPNADAIINPNQPECDFPDKNLAGVGVAFYLLIGLRQQLDQLGWFRDQQIIKPNLATWLDLVAIGTICDVVKLSPTNRLLIDQGLKRIRSSQTLPGIQALIEASDKRIEWLNSTDIGFSIGPKINAAGRMDDMTIGIECLLSESVESAKPQVASLIQLNQTRREVESDALDEALHWIEAELDLTDAPIICVYQPHWHGGVVGLIASRLKSRYHRPCIVFGQDDSGAIKGSCRSVPGCHIRDFLDWMDRQSPALIEKFGGHAMAAGLTIDPARYADFATLCAKSAKTWLQDIPLEQTYWVDANLPASALNTQYALALRLAGPWGNAFEAPLFEGKFEIDSIKIVGSKHFKYVLLPINERGMTIDAPIAAIQFFPEQDEPLAGQQIRCLYQLETNTWAGRTNAQLMVQTFWLDE